MPSPAVGAPGMSPGVSPGMSPGVPGAPGDAKSGSLSNIERGWAVAFGRPGRPSSESGLDELSYR